MTSYAATTAADDYTTQLRQFDELCANEAWKLFTVLCKRAFNADVLALLRTFAANNPHVPLRDHIHLLQRLVGDHVRLALSEADVSYPPAATNVTPQAAAPRRTASGSAGTFKKRSLSLRPPTCVAPIPEDAELSSRPTRAATAGTPAELYGAGGTADAARHTIASPSQSCRQLDAFRRTLVPLPLPATATATATVDIAAAQLAPPEACVRAKSSYRARPNRRSMRARTVSLNLAPHVWPFRRTERKAKK